MTKEQASREWLEINKLLKRLRLMKVGTDSGRLKRHYEISIKELKMAQTYLKPIIDPE